MYLSPQQAQKRFGYHPKTLAEWADEGKIEFIRSPGGHRRYLLTALEGKANSFSSRRVVIYARVSTHSQKEDLASQAKFLQEARESDELIKEIGSGMNLKRRKFLKLMQRVADGEIGEIIVGHKDEMAKDPEANFLSDFEKTESNVV